MECKDLSVQDQIEQVVSLEIRKYNKFNSIIIIFDRLFNSLLSINSKKIYKIKHGTLYLLGTGKQTENGSPMYPLMQLHRGA